VEEGAGEGEEEGGGRSRRKRYLHISFDLTGVPTTLARLATVSIVNKVSEINLEPSFSKSWRTTHRAEDKLVERGVGFGESTTEMVSACPNSPLLPSLLPFFPSPLDTRTILVPKYSWTSMSLQGIPRHPVPCPLLPFFLLIPLTAWLLEFSFTGF
jgi:hypothetical protein